jgi:hypothetical protein
LGKRTTFGSGKSGRRSDIISECSGARVLGC